ncbi:DMT family transporter [Labrys monachus]|uniref:S-adenosylmethionine uptake transporter n=1 Tax=Labrys monachus TaxID=217067 RepID=A0ABU0FC11_9HYPH|nr:DMT family transporter [Labrys monachus]MDQ0392158.1 S-adenosylmethionine uptake transporter [Labrys monachus]
MTSMRPAAHGLGIVLFLTGIFFFALNDALGKWLAMDYAVGQLLLLRSVGACIVLLPMIWRLRINLFDFGQWHLQALRILAMAGDTFSFYYATRTMPLADVMTFYMAAPLIITALSVPLLGERVEPFRWAAVLAGFVGVVIALQPSAAIFTSSSPIALFGAVMFGFSVAVTRRLRRTHWLPLVLWQFVGAGIIGAATIPFAWVTPNPTDLGLMFLVGVVAMLCFVCITRALALAPAAVLAPFQYSAMLWATIMGWMVWRDVPTPPIIIGNAIIIASGLFILYRDRSAGAVAVAEA